MFQAHRPRASLWIAMAAIALLACGLWLARGQWRVRQANGPTETTMSESGSLGGTGADSGDAVIDRALGQIPGSVDSIALKSRWQDEVQGVNVADLNPERREIFVRFANAERCTCGCGYTLAACRAYDTTCPVSLPRVESLLDSVRSGKIRSAEGLRERPVANASGGR